MRLRSSDMALKSKSCLLSLKPSNLQRRDNLVLGANMIFSTPRLSITDDEFDALRPGDRVKVVTPSLSPFSRYSPRMYLYLAILRQCLFILAKFLLCCVPPCVCVHACVCTDFFAGQRSDD